MKTRSSRPWLLALCCAAALAIALAGPASAQQHRSGGSSWHGGSGGWHGGGSWHGGGGGWHGNSGRTWGWGGIFIVPPLYSTCSYAYCYGYVPPPYRPIYPYPPPAYYGY
jgi:hypothetical protein